MNMMTRTAVVTYLILGTLAFTWTATAAAQPLGQPDRGSPGDEMIQAYLRGEADRLGAHFSADVATREGWEAKRPQYLEEYYYMLGLSPRPERTPLQAKTTRTLAAAAASKTRCVARTFRSR